MNDPQEISTLGLATLTTGICMVKGMAGVYEAAEAVLGYPVWTHELGSASKRIGELVQAQHPDFPTSVEGDWQETRDAVLARYGETISVQRGQEQRQSGPVETLAQMLGQPSDDTGESHADD